MEDFSKGTDNKNTAITSYAFIVLGKNSDIVKFRIDSVSSIKKLNAL